LVIAATGFVAIEVVPLSASPLALPCIRADGCARSGYTAHSRRELSRMRRAYAVLSALVLSAVQTETLRADAQSAPKDPSSVAHVAQNEREMSTSPSAGPAHDPPTAVDATADTEPAGTPEGDRPLAKVGLKAALAEALSRELRVRVARAEVARAEAQVKTVRATFLPTLIGHAAYVRLDDARRAGTVVTTPRDQLQADLTLNVPVFAPRAWNDTDFASDNVRVARFDEADTRRTVALVTAQAYLTVIAQHRAIDVTQRALDNANAHYQFAHQRLTGGIGNQVDDVRAAQEVATSGVQLERARAGLYAAQEALGYTLGRRSPVDVEEAFAMQDAPSMADGLASAQTLRGDVNADRSALEAQRNLVADNWAEYAPLLVAQAVPFYREPGTPNNPHTGWQVQLLLSVPFYDGGARYGTIAQRAATLSTREAELEATMRKANSEVRVAFNTARHADASLTSAKQAAGYAAQALRFASMAYEAGASTNIEVVDAERRARDADTAVVIAEDAARQARVSLLAATGRFP
jgi:outer membrane protein TolC